MSGGFTGGLDPLSTDPLGLDNSQSYLGSGEQGGGGWRDTAIPGGYDSEESNRARFLASHRFVSAKVFEVLQPNQFNMLARENF